MITTFTSEQWDILEARTAEIARLNQRIAALEAERRWIPVNSPPKQVHWVLVRTAEAVFPAFYDKGVWWEWVGWQYNDYHVKTQKITGWQELPSLSSAEEVKND